MEHGGAQRAGKGSWGRRGTRQTGSEVKGGNVAHQRRFIQ